MSRKERLENSLTTHHRCPKSKGGKNNPENLSMIPEKQHRGWHTLFHNYTPDVIARIINNVYLDPNYKLLALRNDQLKKAIEIVERAERLLKRKKNK